MATDKENAEVEQLLSSSSEAGAARAAWANAHERYIKEMHVHGDHVQAFGAARSLWPMYISDMSRRDYKALKKIRRNVT